MELAYIVYIGLLIIMVLFSISEVQKESEVIGYSKKNLFLTPLAIVPILIFSLIIGLRYNVGIDYLSYKSDYVSLIDTDRDMDIHFEYGYLSILKALAYLRANFIWPFIITAFIQIYCIYYQSRKNIFLLPFILFFYFVSSNFMYSLNIMRQIMAFNILFIGTSYIIDKKFYKWIGLCLFASLFHTTALFALPFYFLNRDLIKNKYVGLVILPIIFFATEYLFLNYFDMLFEMIAPLIVEGADIEKVSLLDREEVNTEGSGLFSLATGIVYLFFIYNYKECSEYYSKYGFKLFFNLALIAIIIFPFVANNILLDRIVYYFYGFRFVVFAFYAHYFLMVKKNIFTSLVIIAFMLVLFIQFMLVINSGSNGISPFQFAPDF